MITRNSPSTQRWQQVLQQAYRDPMALLADLGLSAEQVSYESDAHKDFAMLVPRSFAARMQAGNPKDPLLLQVLPTHAEAAPQPGYSQDPLQEQAYNCVPGLLHKYQGRVLLTVIGACAINCRYCFRRHFPYAENVTGRNWQAAVGYISADPSIEEVILSGGDPLLATDAHLKPLLTTLSTIPHLKRLRIHSRIPIVLPERLTKGLLALLTELPWPVTLVIHCNHAQEIDQSVIDALTPYRQAGIHLLNQAVLLRDVNDTVDRQLALSERLLQAGVLPYYLHVLDPVLGAAHFDVPEADAIALISSMRQQTAGYLIPKLVREIPGEAAKTSIS